MFQHALIAVDLDSDVPLLECAPDLATWGVVRVSLVYFAKVGYAQGPAFGEEERQRERLQALAEPLRARGTIVDIHVATAGDVGASIAARAAEVGVDLLVVGNRSQNVLERLFLGSVARKVLRRSSVPVLIEWIEPLDGVGDRCQLTCGNTLRHVLVASDLTAAARPVHEAAIELASLGGRVDVMHVTSADDRARFADWPTMARAALGEVHSRITQGGGTGEAFVVEGEASEEILRLAGERDASLLVVGKAGRGDSGMGHTARALSKRAGRPVLMIPNR
ncbi:MAG: universal stress protein [Planctomycetota bacterium]